MLLQEYPALEELAIQALVREPGLSARQVWQSLQAQRHVYTLRGVYKELSKLTEQGILFKRGETYNIRLAWIMNLLSFGDLAYEQYTSTEYLARALGGSVGKSRERFSNLRKLDRLWTQLMLTLHQLYPGRMMCFWIPYQWFSAAHYFTAKQFYQAVELGGHQRLHIIGHDSFLARQALKDLPKSGKYSFAKSPFESDQQTYYTIIADRVITVKLDSQTTAKLHTLFRTVDSAEDLRRYDLESVFGSAVRATLTIEQNEKKADRLKKKFAEFFGVEVH